ncbi:MAG TPA: hypothetical protein PKZ88_08260 [Methanothermobacter sp.]|nr:hypothetical protein [Methanothermobacter sp.]
MKDEKKNVRLNLSQIIDVLKFGSWKKIDPQIYNKIRKGEFIIISKDEKW